MPGDDELQADVVELQADVVELQADVVELQLPPEAEEGMAVDPDSPEDAYAWEDDDRGGPEVTDE